MAKEIKNRVLMKKNFLTLFALLAAFPVWAQPDYSGDTLAADFRYLVRQLEETHPDPYTGFGGKVFFHKAAFELEHHLRNLPDTTLTYFCEQTGAFLAHLQDGHTYLSAPGASAREGEARRIPAYLRVIPEGLIMQGVPAGQRSFLGSRLVAVEGCGIDEVLERVAALQACENLYDRYTVFRIHFGEERFMRRLFPQVGDSLHFSLLTPSDSLVSLSLPFLPDAEANAVPKAWCPTARAVPRGQLAYQFMDADKQVMMINIDQISARENFEYMYEHGWSGYKTQLPAFYRTLGWEMPSDTLQAIGQLPSFSGVFGRMLREMKQHGSSTLIIDLRSNGGGWTGITLPTLYQLYGRRYLETDLSDRFYRLLSPLYLEKLNTTLEEFNRSNGADWQLGDYTFSIPAAGGLSGDALCERFVRGCMSSVREELAAQQGEPLYTPRHVYVVTDANTFSAAFHYAFYLWKMGATVVGVPSRQAPNTYMEVTPFRLPRTGLEGSISNSMQVFLPPADRRAKVFWPDLIPAYEDYREARFDNEAEIIFLLKSIGLPGLPG